MTLEESKKLIEKGYEMYLKKNPHSKMTFQQYQELAVEAIEEMILQLQIENN